MFTNAIQSRINRRFGTFRGSIRLLLAHAEWNVGSLRPFLGHDLSRVRRVVFACQGNICRSAFAEWCARSRGVRAASFGLATGKRLPAYPEAVEMAARFGIDLSAHRTTDVDDFTFETGDLVLAMEIRQCRHLRTLLDCDALQLGLLGVWSTPRRPHIHDPHGLSAAYFSMCFSVISSAIEGLVADLKAVGAPATGATDRAEVEATRTQAP